MLKVFNTLGREQQVFTPIEEGKILFYQCGPTVYSTQHIGNMRAAVLGDLIRRSLMYLGYDVKFIKNYTDVGHLVSDEDAGEDKMEKGAKNEGLSPIEIANKYIKQYEDDINQLNILEATFKPRATEYIPQMIQMVQVLLDKGFAYSTSKAIYFDVSKAKDYTRLSGQNLELNKVGAGVGDVSDENKKNPQDFALWFFKTGVHKNAIQTWESPFQSSEVQNGEGFPGWHIECSAMIKELLGDTIDIHMGGVEHIPVHHTNEIAQSESANGVKYVNYWIHHEHLDIDGVKISKSLGNGYFLSDLIEKGYKPVHLRFFFLQSHLRSKQNFTFEALDSSKNAYEKLVNFVSEWSKDSSKEHQINAQPDQNLKTKFTQSLEDDFNIPQALSVVWEATKADLSSQVKLATILDFDKVLGLDLAKIVENPIELEIPNEAKILIEERNIARLNKDWAKSDELRDQLEREYDLKVKDTSGGQMISK